MFVTPPPMKPKCAFTTFVMAVPLKLPAPPPAMVAPTTPEETEFTAAPPMMLGAAEVLGSKRSARTLLALRSSATLSVVPRKCVPAVVPALPPAIHSEVLRLARSSALAPTAALPSFAEVTAPLASWVAPTAPVTSVPKSLLAANRSKSCWTGAKPGLERSREKSFAVRLVKTNLPSAPVVACATAPCPVSITSAPGRRFVTPAVTVATAPVTL